MEMEEKSHLSISIIIPAYNEEAGIEHTLQELCQEPGLAEVEIIVVDDGSSDRTGEKVAGFPGVILLRHRANRGYGTSIVTATRRAKGDYIIWCDADGQHRAEDVARVAEELVSDDLEYCIGVRNSDSYEERGRKFGKFLLRVTIRLIAKSATQDFNSGLRGFKREILIRYLNLLPKRFGASTTTTLLMFEQEHYGREIPIIARQRIGKSTVKQVRDGLATLLIVLRILMLFRPLHVFGGIGTIFVILGSVYGFYVAISTRTGFPTFAVLVVILGLQAFFFGLLADQIAFLRRENFH
jgi:glycosyltransferase involved in cell wall biosynthesis